MRMRTCALPSSLALVLLSGCGAGDESLDDSAGSAGAADGGAAAQGGAGGDNAGGGGGVGGNSGSEAGGGSGDGGAAGTPSVSTCPTDPSFTVGTKLHEANAFEGYTLFAPLTSNTTYLIDMCGRVVHSWVGTAQPGNAVYLLENGDLLRTENTRHADFETGGAGGRVLRIDWDGAIVWQYDYSNTEHRQHHDVELLPDGNILMIAWQMKSGVEAIAQGRDPARLQEGEMWADSVIEIEPEGSSGANVVWEWHAWDHMVQDHDNTKANYGTIADSPELANINHGNNNQADWLHVNGIDYNADLDQIVISTHGFSELWVIDHSTTTGEAASHRGGRSGKGGDILYRWGNPQAYGAGTAGDQVLFTQHDTQWIEDGLVGAGNLLVFNNGQGRPEGSYSTVEELVPPVDVDGVYSLGSGPAYGPPESTWTYEAPNPTDFFSGHISGAQRLPNGNTLICSGSGGIFFEVSGDGSIVWEYVNPVARQGALTQGEPLATGPQGAGNPVFRAIRYNADYPGLVGRDLTPGDVLEL